ncbi:MAG: signal peptidase I [Acidimicrobiales bacterium]
MKPGRTTATVERLLQPSALLLVWVYLYLLALLAGWVLLASLATGYQPVVVTTGSMRPAVEPGDVLLIADPPADQMLPQRAVILFERDSGELVTHRVYAVENDEYVTKGDANPSVDLERVRPDQTLGVGRIVVPLVGLPIVWYQTQNYVALGAWIIVTLAAFVVSIRSAIAVLRSPRDRSAEAQGQPLAQRAIRRVRILVGAMIISQYVIEPSRFDIAGEAIPRGFVFGASLLGLGALTLISFRVDRSGTPQQAERFAIIELVGDTVFVIVLTAAAGTNGIGWVLFALPIVEAAARYRVSGALLHWMGLTAATLATQIALIERTDAGDGLLIDKLDQVLDQLSVLLLVVIPGAYLAEQLIGDVGNQRRATEIAQSRNAMLEGVVEVGHEINRLGSDVFEVMVAAATELGFDAADICVAVDDGAWHVVAGSATADTVVLPTPGDPASTLRVTDLSTPNVIVDSDDDDATEVGALATSGFGAIVRTTVSEQPVAVALRAAVLPHRSITSAMLDALRLLAGQATVALQNDRLVGELQTLHNELHHQANHDVLTGLPNRAQFLQRTADALDTVAAEGSTVVLFSDLNGFKPVNDQYGHDVGDELLRVIARRLSNAVGERGLVARLGGDEFTVLLEASNADGAAPSPHGWCRSSHSRSGSVIVSYRSAPASASPSASELRAAELLRRADVAMYGAKSDDRAAWKVYDPAMEEADRRQQWMVGELGRAIAGDGLTLDYQLVVSSRTGAPIGVEALLRWRHRDLGPIPSPEIILLAEAGNLTDALHRWIMRRGLSRRRWLAPDHGRRILRCRQCVTGRAGVT